MERVMTRLPHGLAVAAAATAVVGLSKLVTSKAANHDAWQVLADKIPFPRIDDPLVIDYLLNTFVNKIPIADVRMHLYRRAGIKVDPTSNIMMHAWVLQARDITIGPNCVIGPYTTLDGRGGLTIGRNVNLAGQVLTIGGYHVVDSKTAEGILGKIVIEDNAWVAMRATILPGVTIGEGAYVGAAALVNRDIAPYTLVGGVPAKKIRDRSRDIQYTLHHFPNWV